MLILRSLIFNIMFFSWTGLCALAFIPLSYGPRQRLIRTIGWYFKSLGFLERTIIGLSYRVEGIENLPKGPVLIAAKHQSMWETMSMAIMFPDPAFVLKRELLKIPLWGHLVRQADMIPVERGGGQPAIDGMLAAARRIASQGRPIVIFPQGTRVAVGQWRRYKIGIARLYEGLNIPLVPVALNSGVFWGRHKFIKRPGVITVKILPPIPAGLSADVVMQKLEYVLETESDALAVAAGAPPTARPSDAPSLVNPEV